VVVLSETVSDSDIFKRSGADLVIEKKIMLLEALIGADFLVDHLNGSQIRIQTDNKNTIKPDETRTVEGLGMPIHEKPYVFGNMFIVFKVEFPQSIPI
jgi:DnaJ family protein A protein 2